MNGWLLAGAYLLSINLIALSTFWLDKRRAQRGGRRVPEARLLLLAALGGSAGAWLAMRLFRHKTRHRKFTAGVPLLLALQCGLLLVGWLWFAG